MLRALARRLGRYVVLLLLLSVLLISLTGLDGSQQVPSPTRPAEPGWVGPVTQATASAAGQGPGAVRLTWNSAQNAQVHFVMYTRAEEAEAGNYTNARVEPFSGSEGVITGLRSGTRYQFIVIGMRWNWIDFRTVWGDWSGWVSATPSGPSLIGPAPPPPSGAEPTEVGSVGQVMASSAGQGPGSVRLTWTRARNAQVHFVMYTRAAEAATGYYVNAQMMPFSGSEGVISGLDGGTEYQFIVIGMRWNWRNYGTVWGDWSSWVSATPSGGATVSVPDLVVGQISISPDALSVGETFTLSATVSNRGGTTSQNTTLRYYRSADRVIASNDTPVGTDRVAGLGASRNEGHSISLTAPSSPGTYYYGACVDTVTGETNIQNNCSVAARLAVGGEPDLVVDSVSVNPDTVGPGGSFTLDATVTNQGGGVSTMTTLRYYRSGDRIITSGDALLGADQVSALAVGGDQDHEVVLLAPSDAGTYYYGACVVSIAGESDTRNNCSQAAALTVVAGPDLVVGSVRVSDGNLEPRAIFTLFATVHNQGGSPSRNTTLRYYRSTDGVITTGDTPVGSDLVPALDAGRQDDDFEIDLTAESVAGTYYYGACVDTVTGESDFGNNCSSAVAVTVAGDPDLIIRSFSVSDDTLEPEERFTLNVTVYNQGDGPAGSTDVRYYRSTDRTITTQDTEVGRDGVQALDAYADDRESLRERAPSDPGTYYYGACVDTVARETDTRNNCSQAVPVTVTGEPDLVIESTWISDDGPRVRASITLSATVGNRGNAASGSMTWVRYYLSTDRSITSSDRQVYAARVPTLGVGRDSGSLSVTADAPSTAGTYYYIACVDTVAGETDTTNNCTSGRRVDVENYPDYRIESIGSIPPSTLYPGDTIVLAVVLHNDGGSAYRDTKLRYYRSSNNRISSQDVEVGTDDIPARSAGGGIQVSIRLTLGNDIGTFYYGACVDPLPGESDTTDNCSDAVRVVVSSPVEFTSTPSCTTGTTLFIPTSVEMEGRVLALIDLREVTVLWWVYRSNGTVYRSGAEDLGSMDRADTKDFSASTTYPGSGYRCVFSFGWDR